MRTIKAPGVQVNEIDRSDYTSTAFVGKNIVLVPGFAQKGDDYTPKYIFNKQGFFNTYGYPTSLAEKYFYNACNEVFKAGDVVIGAKLPYDNNSLDNFTFTKYKVEDNSTDLSSPIDIITKQYNSTLKDESVYALYTTLSNLFFLETDDVAYPFNDSLISALEEITYSVDEILFIKDFNEWLSSHAIIDYSLLPTFNLLFNNTKCFKNLYALLNMNGNVKIELETPKRYITTDDLKIVLSDKIPDNILPELSNSNKVRTSFYEFSNAFKDFFQKTENFPDISSAFDDIILSNPSLSAELDNIYKIYNKLQTTGLSDYSEVKYEFLKGLSLSDVSDYYNNYKTIYNDASINSYKNILGNILPDIPDDEFNSLQFTSIKETFPNIKKIRKIHSLNSNENIKVANNTVINTNTGLISIEQLDQYLTGMDGELANNEILIVDKTRGQYNRDKTMQDISAVIDGTTTLSTNQYLGIVPIITTVTNALYFQDVLNSKDKFSPYNVISSIQTIYSDKNEMLPGVKSGINYKIPLGSNSSEIETVGSQIVQYFPKVVWKDDNTIDTTYFKQVGVVVCKMLIDSSSYNKIVLSPVESFVGSFDKKAKNIISNTSIFIDDIINNNSNYIYFFSKVKDIDNTDMFYISNQTATSLGFYESDCEKLISAKKSIIDGLDIMFQKLSDSNQIRIDILADAGMSDICHYIGTTCKDEKGKYEPTSELISPYFQINNNSLYYWKQIINKYDDFCKNIRKDCMFICDAPRSLSLEGVLPLIRKTKPQNTVKNSILPKVKCLTGINTSYGAGYATWVSIIDDISFETIWVPPTIKVLGSYLNYNEWEAPAGLTRGKLNSTYNISFNLTNKEAETFYENNWNYIVSYPTDGIVIEGQKTFQQNKTAFDRVNVRRTFLYIERNIKKISRGILYEQITDYAIAGLNSRINEFLRNVQYSGAILDYVVICNSSNNTPITIDKNEVHVSIGIKPTKVAEFIILNFVCTSQGANVIEVTQSSL